MDPLHDRDHVPDAAAFADASGAARPLWDRLVGWLAATYGVQGEPLWTGKDDGWVLRFRRAGRALLTLVSRPTGVRAMVVIGPSAWAAVEPGALSPAVRDAWDRARPYPDGRWLFLDVTDAVIAGDIERLVALKSPPPRRPRPSAARDRVTVGG